MVKIISPHIEEKTILSNIITSHIDIEVLDHVDDISYIRIQLVADGYLMKIQQKSKEAGDIIAFFREKLPKQFRKNKKVKFISYLHENGGSCLTLKYTFNLFESAKYNKTDQYQKYKYKGKFRMR